MSNYDYEDDDFDFGDSSNDLVKQLRKQLKAKERELSEKESALTNLSKAQRERAIKDTLASRGVNGKIAAFIPQDIDPTEESVSKWLEDYADVFGIETNQNQATPNVDPAQAAAYKRMTNAVESGSSPAHNDSVMHKLVNANSKEELDEIIRMSGL